MLHSQNLLLSGHRLNRPECVDQGSLEISIVALEDFTWVKQA